MYRSSGHCFVLINVININLEVLAQLTKCQNC